jgi:hypothetical protein
VSGRAKLGYRILAGSLKSLGVSVLAPVALAYVFAFRLSGKPTGDMALVFLFGSLIATGGFSWPISCLC